MPNDRLLATNVRSISPYTIAVNDYLLALKSEGKARKTVDNYAHVLKDFREFAGPVDPAEPVPGWEAHDFADFWAQEAEVSLGDDGYTPERLPIRALVWRRVVSAHGRPAERRARQLRHRALRALPDGRLRPSSPNTTMAAD